MVVSGGGWLADDDGAEDGPTAAGGGKVISGGGMASSSSTAAIKLAITKEKALHVITQIKKNKIGSSPCRTCNCYRIRVSMSSPCAVRVVEEWSRFLYKTPFQLATLLQSQLRLVADLQWALHHASCHLAS